MINPSSYKRDPKTGALLNVNKDEFNRFRSETAAAQQIGELSNKIDSMNLEFKAIRSMIAEYFPNGAKH